MMSVLRLVMGFCTFSTYACCFALGTVWNVACILGVLNAQCDLFPVAELCPNEKRAVVTFVFDMYPGCGRWIVAVLAYVVRDWRGLLTAYSLPPLICVLFFW